MVANRFKTETGADLAQAGYITQGWLKSKSIAGCQHGLAAPRPCESLIWMRLLWWAAIGYCWLVDIDRRSCHMLDPVLAAGIPSANHLVVLGCDFSHKTHVTFPAILARPLTQLHVLVLTAHAGSVPLATLASTSHC